jgi:hypothetical protein
VPKLSLAVAVAFAVLQLMQASNAQVADSPAVTSSSSEEDKVLVPGSGFKDVVAQPDPRGTGPYSDAKAIARWDVVPYQTFETTINIGIIAFHIKDILKVSFSANGGPWKDVTSMTLNPDTNVVEYWATLRAADFPDGLVEIRAIVYPNTGVARVLAGAVSFISGTNTAATNGEHSMWLFANAGNTLPRPEIFVSPSTGDDGNPGTAEAPVATLKRALDLTASKDGARVILTEEGKYNPDREKETLIANNRWVTVEAGPALSRDQVSIAGTGDDDRLLPKIARLEWKNLTIRPDTYSYINEGGVKNGSSQWYNSCLLTSAELNPSDGQHWRSNVYATDSRVENFSYGFILAQLVRNCAVKDVFDAYQCSQLVINCKVERIRPSVQAAQHHPDVYQTWGDMKNVIVYGLTGDEIDGTQVLFINQPLAVGPDMTDAAFVDWNIKTYDAKGGPPFSQLQGPVNNMLLRNVQISNQRLLFRADAKGLNHFEGKNVELQHCKFANSFKPREVPPGVTIKGGVGAKAAVQPRSKGYPSSVPISEPAVPPSRKP